MTHTTTTTEPTYPTVKAYEVNMTVEQATRNPFPGIHACEFRSAKTTAEVTMYVAAFHREQAREMAEGIVRESITGDVVIRHGGITRVE